MCLWHNHGLWQELAWRQATPVTGGGRPPSRTLSSEKKARAEISSDLSAVTDTGRHGTLAPGRAPTVWEISTLGSPEGPVCTGQTGAGPGHAQVRLDAVTPPAL